jgi:hypothetical protein
MCVSGTCQGHLSLALCLSRASTVADGQYFPCELVRRQSQGNAQLLANDLNLQTRQLFDQQRTKQRACMTCGKKKRSLCTINDPCATVCRDLCSRGTGTWTLAGEALIPDHAVPAHTILMPSIHCVKTPIWSKAIISACL